MKKIPIVIITLLASIPLYAQQQGDGPPTTPCTASRLSDQYTDISTAPQTLWQCQYKSSAYSWQLVYPTLNFVVTAPSGSCAPDTPNQQVKSTGVQYSCQNVVSGVGTWGMVQGGNAIYATSYGVKADTQALTTCSSTNGSTTITCPSGTFTSSDVGKIEFGTSDPNNGSVVVPQGTIAMYISSSSVTVSAAATATQSGNLVFIWGHDDTTAYADAWTAAASKCDSLIGASGKSLIQSAEFISLPNSECASSVPPYFSVGFSGPLPWDVNGTWLITTPDFNFSSCTGGTGHGCFMTGPSARFSGFTIWGGGNNLSGQNLNGVHFVEATQSAGFNEVDFVGWGDQSTNSVCFYDGSNQTGLFVGGNEYCGDVGVEVTLDASPATADGWYFGSGGSTTLQIDSGGVLLSKGGFYDGNQSISGKLISVGDHFDGGSTTINSGGSCQAFGSYGAVYNPSACPSPSSSYLPAEYDDFTRANGSLTTPWVIQPGTGGTLLTINGNELECPTTAGCNNNLDEQVALNANQEVQVTLLTIPTSSDQAGAYLRASSSAATGYLCQYLAGTPATLQIASFVNDTYTTIATFTYSTNPTAGSILSFQAVGTILSCETSGMTAPLQVVNSVTTGSGYAGIELYGSGLTGRLGPFIARSLP